MKKLPGFTKAIILAMLILQMPPTFAQQLLDKSMSLEVREQRLGEVLEIISNAGNFYFSYNSNIIKNDSLISARFTGATVKNILSSILGSGFEFWESGNYIILRRPPVRLKLVTSAAISEDKFYTITGFVIDDETGAKISDASIYERNRLAVASTNANGYFRLRLKNRYDRASITVSKEFYQDTTVAIQAGYNQSITITLVPLSSSEHTTIIGPAGLRAPEAINLEIPVNDSMYWLYRYMKTDSALVEKTALGKFLVSSKAKLQTINLRKFFVARPAQVSIVPGVSSNGRLNSQVINNFSFNMFGGYSGGTNGFELGGLFNIDKRSVQYVQVAGLANVVGGHLNGLQLGGIINTVLDSVRGLQIGGIGNFAGRGFRGAQIGGIYNHTGRSFNGAQIGGIVNFTGDTTRGIQVAGIANVSLKEVKGVQIGGILNYTKKLSGVQIGLINISDTSDGYSIGLINIVLKGYHKLSFSANETINTNAEFKTGSRRLYSIFLGGFNAGSDDRIWSFGYGLGSEIPLGKRFSFNPELSAQHLYLGSWDYYNILSRATLLFNFKISKGLSVFAGPVYSVYASDQDVHFDGFKRNIPPNGYHAHKFSSTVSGWAGWSAGVNIF